MGKYEFGKLLGERGINRHYELAVISNTSPLREALVAGWLQVREVNNPSLVQLLQRDLDRGEAEAIALALLLDAVVSYDLGDKQAAIADYNQAIKINPNYAHAYYNRGNAHYLLENNQAAISDYQQAVKLYQQQGGNEDLLRKAQDRIRELQR
ncbi:tetratricopeptide repeat protein [Dolichospermum sp. LEGE 00246]|nr:tetratricopeptide repeat protein [Dolichospermum sp. LEGE 00246]